jgi:hypothetical protein
MATRENDHGFKVKIKQKKEEERKAQKHPKTLDFYQINPRQWLNVDGFNHHLISYVQCFFLNIS